MNNRAGDIIKLGLIFASAIVVIDAFLAPFSASLDWFSLAILFLFLAIAMLISVTSAIPWGTRKLPSVSRERNDLDYLTDLIDAAIYRKDSNASRILSDEIKSLSLGAIALRARLSKQELLELIERDPESLQGIVRDSKTTKLMADYRQASTSFNEERLQKVLSEIQS
jgi:hypothetical protein